MAEVEFRETKYDIDLAPGKSIWIQIGESPAYARGAVAVSATPHKGRGGDMHVLKVENVNVTRVVKSQAGGPKVGYHAGCNVMNNGKTTVEEWAVCSGVIVP